MKTNTAIFTCLAMALGLGAITGQAEKALATEQRQQPPGSSAKTTTPGKLLFAPLPVQVDEHDSEFADDLPSLIVLGVILDPFASSMARTTTRRK